MLNDFIEIFATYLTWRGTCIEKNIIMGNYEMNFPIKIQIRVYRFFFFMSGHFTKIGGKKVEALKERKLEKLKHEFCQVVLLF